MIFFLLSLIVNMDELSTCGQKIEVFETPVIINARSSITPSSPSPYCQVILETTSRDGAYRLQITIKSVAIKDSTFMLRIYDGQGALNLLVSYLLVITIFYLFFFVNIPPVYALLKQSENTELIFTS